MNTPFRILMTGSSGLIGSALARSFSSSPITPADFSPGGFSLVRLVRTPQAVGSDELSWFPQASSPFASLSPLENFDAAIHLSGANVAAHRWTPAYKKQIVESRVKTTEVLAASLARLKRPPKVLLCASAIGIYGNCGDEVLTEASSIGSGFLAETCALWEAAAQPAKDAGIRVAHLRFGVVLSGKGGALAKMLPAFRLGLAGRLGSGRQWISWISLPDVVAAMKHVLKTPELAGPINFVAPDPSTNAEFTRLLAKAVHRPALFPAPAFALRAILGQMADETLLASARVIPERLTQSGFLFQHAQLAPALESSLTKSI
jgi:uncharacterized protein